jgi:predicted AlkP superfamily pyrophosphatase or phosphodiesterase
MKEYSMTGIAPTISKLLNVRSPKQNADVISEIINDIGHQERLAVIIFDAFGIATWKRYKELTPNFNLLADRMLLHIRSVLPAKTPVNFATMMTGAPSDVHKIRDRSEPLIVETVFHVLSETHKKSAAVGRKDSTVGILLSRFADYKCLAESNTDEEILQLAIRVIEDKSPEFILMQLLDIDDAGHKYGLECDEFRTAVSNTDKRLGEIMPYLASKNYGLMILADHGAHQAGEKATHDGKEDDLVVPLTWKSKK